jgi:hypothetical protein
MFQPSIDVVARPGRPDDGVCSVRRAVPCQTTYFFSVEQHQRGASAARDQRERAEDRQQRLDAVVDLEQARDAPVLRS